MDGKLKDLHRNPYTYISICSLDGELDYIFDNQYEFPDFQKKRNNKETGNRNNPTSIKD